MRLTISLHTPPAHINIEHTIMRQLWPRGLACTLLALLP